MSKINKIIKLAHAKGANAAFGNHAAVEKLQSQIDELIKEQAAEMGGAIRQISEGLNALKAEVK